MKKYHFLFVGLFALAAGIATAFLVNKPVRPQCQTTQMRCPNTGKCVDPIMDECRGSQSDSDAINRAFLTKYDYQESVYQVDITFNDGVYAAGPLMNRQLNRGEGYLYAKKTGGRWEIVAAGRGSGACEDLKKYPDFPPAFTSQCTDGQSIANPASVNCEQQGGNLKIEKRGDGGEYGACYFEDGRVCEEWALMRGECLVGGVKVTGYATAAGRYCAITGGQYLVTGTKNGVEQGICTRFDKTQYDAWDNFNGK